MELRCPSKLHGILTEDGVVEVKCASRFCGHEAGTVVLHRFNAVTGELVNTVQFKDPRKERGDGSRHSPAVRSA